MPWNPEHYMKKKEVIKILEDNKITNVIPEKVFYKDENSDVVSLKEKRICPNCKGNGFTKHSWESVEEVLQCKACSSEGEIPADKYVHQTYTETDRDGNESTTNYVGPLLDYEIFNNLMIVV